MAGERGSGAGKGGGTGGVIRDAGGSFGKMEAAHEDQYFYNLVRTSRISLVSRQSAPHRLQTSTLVLVSAKGTAAENAGEPSRRDFVPRGTDQAPPGGYKPSQKADYRYGTERVNQVSVVLVRFRSRLSQRCH